MTFSTRAPGGTSSRQWTLACEPSTRTTGRSITATCTSTVGIGGCPGYGWTAFAVMRDDGEDTNTAWTSARPAAKSSRRSDVNVAGSRGAVGVIETGSAHAEQTKQRTLTQWPITGLQNRRAPRGCGIDFQLNVTVVRRPSEKDVPRGARWRVPPRSTDSRGRAICGSALGAANGERDGHQRERRTDGGQGRRPGHPHRGAGRARDADRDERRRPRDGAEQGPVSDLRGYDSGTERGTPGAPPEVRGLKQHRDTNAEQRGADEPRRGAREPERQRVFAERDHGAPNHQRRAEQDAEPAQRQRHDGERQHRGRGRDQQRVADERAGEHGREVTHRQRAAARRRRAPVSPTSAACNGSAGSHSTIAIPRRRSASARAVRSSVHSRHARSTLVEARRARRTSGIGDGLSTATSKPRAARSTTAFSKRASRSGLIAITRAWGGSTRRGTSATSWVT